MTAEPKRSALLLRLLKAVICMAAFEVTRVVLWALVLFQHLWALATRRPNEPVRRFTARAACYAHTLLRYAGTCSTEPPFPFAHLPEEKECVPPEANPDLTR